MLHVLFSTSHRDINNPNVEAIIMFDGSTTLFTFLLKKKSEKNPFLVWMANY